MLLGKVFLEETKAEDLNIINMLLNLLLILKI